MTNQASVDAPTVLYIEDEDEYREKLVAVLKPRLNISQINVGEFRTERNKGETAEQFQLWLESKLVATPNIDGVILDSDLSGFGNGISKETLLAVFRRVGIPVCRYSKRTKGTTSERLKHYAKLSIEGAASILVPGELMNGSDTSASSSPDALAVWLEAAFTGFADIRQAYRKLPKDSTVKVSPSALLAQLLGLPDIELDLMGYTGASLFFFGDHLAHPNNVDPIGRPEHRISEHSLSIATMLGYWLYNYIIAFPGPILNIPAAAAFLGVKSEGLDIQKFASAMDAERYTGPFGECQSLFLRQKLEALLLECGESGVELLTSRGIDAEPIYEDDHHRSGTYCIATNASIRSEDGVGPIDFIPGGASDLCRISKPIYKRLMPWLNI